MYDEPQWRTESAAFRAEHPLCCCELHHGRPGSPPSQVVDHVIPHRGDRTLFYERSNWCAKAKACHDSKSMRLDRGDAYDDGIHTASGRRGWSHS